MSDSKDDSAPVEAVPETPDTQALQAEVDKWKALSRKNEDRFKALSLEFEDFQKAREADARKREKEVRAQARDAALSEVAPKLVDAELRAAASAAGVPLPSAEFLNLSSFVGEDGNPDPARIENFISTLPNPNPGKAYAQDIGLGRQGGKAAGQLTRADLSRMTAQEINQARMEGRLDALMRGEI